MLRYVDHLDALDKESEDNYTPPSSNSDASEKKEAEKRISLISAKSCMTLL